MFGAIVGVLANLGEDEYEAEQKVVNIDSYLTAYDVPDSLQQRVHEYLLAVPKMSDPSEHKIPKYLPPSLQLAVSMPHALASPTNSS